MPPAGEGGGAIRVRVRHTSIYHWWSSIFVTALIDFYAKEVVYHCRWERAEEREAHGVATCGSMQATPRGLESDV